MHVKYTHTLIHMQRFARKLKLINKDLGKGVVIGENTL